MFVCADMLSFRVLSVCATAGNIRGGCSAWDLRIIKGRQESQGLEGTKGREMSITSRGHKQIEKLALGVGGGRGRV